MKLLKALNPFVNSSKAIVFISILLMALALHCAPWNKKKVIANDVVIYYEYLTAAFMFQDMTFQFAAKLPEDFDGQIWLGKTEEGQRAIKMTSGTALMISPFYMMAAGINKTIGGKSYGYSPLFQFFVFLSSFFYCLLGLVIQRKILRKFYEDHIVALVLLMIGLGTNLAYYTSVEAGMSHAYSFFLFSWFLWVTIKWHENPTLKQGALLGLILGLITLVRPPNAIIAFIPVFYGLKGKGSLAEKWNLIKGNIPSAALAIFIFLAVSALQLVLWKAISGKWFLYGYADEGFFWNDPKIGEVLFSFRKGFLLYAPVLILGFIGLFIRHQKTKSFGLASLVFLSLNIYLISSWWCWWYGGGFGMRSMIESTAVLSLFMGITIEFIMNKLKTTGVYIVGVFCALCLSLNFVQTVQYTKGILHYDGMTSEAYRKIFLKFKYPVNYSDYISSPNYNEAKKGIR
jgi:hypothetical protein